MCGIERWKARGFVPPRWGFYFLDTRNPGRCPGLACDWAFGPQANPELAQAARDVVVSHHKLGEFGQRRGDQALAKKHRAACHAVLHKYVSAGVTYDAPVMNLYQELHAEFDGGK
jgi:hypothetical protein